VSVSLNDAVVITTGDVVVVTTEVETFVEVLVTATEQKISFILAWQDRNTYQA
jgi:hypothetical protein